MEGCIVEQDYDEFEKLLGEIPNATSGNHLLKQTSLTIHSQEMDRDSIRKTMEFSSSKKAGSLSSQSRKASEPSNFPLPATNRGCMSYNGDLAFSKCPQKLQRKLNKGYEFPEAIHREENSNLPDEKCLARLLEEMSIEENLTSKPSSPAPVTSKQSPLNRTFLQNEQNVNHQNNSILGYDTIDMSLPPSGTLTGVTLSSIELEAQSPVMTRNELIDPCDRINGQCNVKLFKPGNVYEPNQIARSLVGNFSDHQQVCPMNTMAMPNSCFNTHQLLPTAQGVQLPNVYQPNYYMDTRSPPSHIAQQGMLWHSMEDERFGRFYQQYLYAQNLQNQRPEVHQVPKNINFGRGPFNGNTLHQCFEFPIPQRLEHCNQNLHLNGNTIYDKSNLLDYCQYQRQPSSERFENFCSWNGEKVLSANGLSCSVKDFQRHQMFDKVGIHGFPEKILTRSHGVNSVRVLRPSLFAPDQPLLFDENSLRWSNGNARQPYGLNNGSLQLDNQSYRGSCSDVFYSGIASKSMQKKYNSVNEVLGRIVLLAKDQHGCRFLQRKFAEGSQEDIDKIFSEIIFHIIELMTDPFGNYLIQKLLEVCNEEKMMFILKVVTRNNDELIRISCDMHGTRAVQKIIETVRTPEQISMVVSSLAPNIVSVMKHINGNHVAQRCLQYLSKYSKLLVDAAISHCVELATDRQGCCVLQKCLMHSDDDQKQMLIAKISSYSLILSKDQYGNYVVQYILDLHDPWATTVVLQQLMGNYDHLSVQKYSSNVVEKCLELAEKDNFAKIIQELMRSPQLSQILQDPYGNYVMQTALIKSKVHEDLHRDLVEAIISHSSALRSSPYGKKVLSTALMSLKK
ncbi:uncharacterized protein LOC110096511 isoform X1 [Dendrobium catenatum]|uniref:Pumilio like 12 n=1 Tax=Dendrobium catenatum TaxID=906689 RepID=A0A2I0WL95_9ASPA|nr:uncharacterized protein LOC110096511 isoform X1 [Dendrobium catenatum]PKU76432.1 Pumilio like 12 [Dendrobium catenatum]